MSALIPIESLPDTAVDTTSFGRADFQWYTKTSGVLEDWTTPQPMAASAGDLLVVKIADEQFSGTSSVYSVSSTPTLTWTKQIEDVSGGSHCYVAIYTAVVAATGPVTVTLHGATPTGGSNASQHWDVMVERWINHGGVGAVATASTTATNPSFNTGSVASSTSKVTFAFADFAAVNAAHTYRNSANEELYDPQGTAYTVYHGFESATGSGTNTYGLSTGGGAGSIWNAVSLEIKASGFSGSAPLSGAGTLTQSAPLPNPIVTAPLTGSGTLTQSAVPTPITSAALSGDGTLTQSAVPKPVSSAALSGDGTLAQSAVPKPIASAALSGDGTLSATATSAITGATATLSGSGALSTTATITAVGSATLSGSGTLTTVATITAAGSATLAGSGTLTTAAVPNPTGAASLSGSGTLGGSGVASSNNFNGTADFSGSGTVSQSAVPSPISSAAFAGAGTLSASGVALIGGIGRVQAASNGASATSCTVTLAAAPTSGNLLIAWADSDATVTIGGSGWTAGPSLVGGNGAYVWYKFAGGSEPSSVTFTPSVSDDIVAGLLEYTGISATGFDVQNSTAGSVTAQTSTSSVSVTTTGSGAELIVAVAALHSASSTVDNATAPTWTNGFTNVQSQVSAGSTTSTHCQAFVGERVVGSAGTYSTSVSWSTVSYTDVPILAISFKVASTAFSGSAGLSGSGSLTQAGTLAASGTATLSGAGTLTQSATIAVDRVGALSGSGTLAAAGVPAPLGTAALSGSGTLTTVATEAASGSTTLSGSGTLSTSATITAVGTATLAGSGSLTAAATAALSGSISLSGSGTLSTTAVPAPTGTASFSGSGSLSTSSSGTASGSGSLTGSGTLSTSAVVAVSGTAGLSGSGTLAGSGSTVQDFPGTASFSGSGALTTTATLNVLRSPQVSGSGTLAVTGTAALPVSVNLSGSGTLTTTAAPKPTATVALSGSGSLTTAALVTASGTAHYSGTGTLAGTGSATISPTQALLSGTGTLVAVGSDVTVTGAATLAGSGLFLAAGGGIEPRSGSGDASGSGTLTASFTTNAARTASFTGNGALLASPAAGLTSAAALTGSGSVAGVGSLSEPHSGDVQLTGGGVLAAVGTPAIRATASPTGSGALVAYASDAVAAFSSDGSLSASTAGTPPEVRREQAVSNGGRVASLDVTFTTPPKRGDLLIAWANSDATVTMSGSGWDLAGSVIGGSGVYVWYKVAGISEPSTITFTPSVLDDIVAGLIEYSGMTPDPFEVLASTNNSGGLGTSTFDTSVTTTAPHGGLLLALGALHLADDTFSQTANTPVWTNGFTNFQSQASSVTTVSTRVHSFVADKVVTENGTYDTTLSWTGVNYRDKPLLLVSFVGDSSDKTGTASFRGNGSLTSTATAVGGPPVSRIQEASNGARASSLVVTLAAPPTPGNLLVAWADSDATVTRNGSGWTLATSLIGGSGVYAWYKIAGASEPSSVTFTPSVLDDIVAGVLEYTGVQPSPLDVTNTTNNNGGQGLTTFASTVTSTAPRGGLLLAIAALHGSDDTFSQVASGITWANSFTNIQSVHSSVTTQTTRVQTFVGERITVANGTASTTASWSGVNYRDKVLALLAFKGVTPDRVGPAPFAGTGSLVAVGSAHTSGAVAVQGSGVLASVGGAFRLFASAVFGSSGVFTALLKPFERSADFSGAGQLAVQSATYTEQGTQIEATVDDGHRITVLGTPDDDGRITIDGDPPSEGRITLSRTLLRGGYIEVDRS